MTWTQDALLAFSSSKEALATATLLFHPKLEAPTSIMTDASDNAIGAVLQQQTDALWHPIFYFYRALTQTKSRYSTFDKELLAIYAAIKHFRHY